MMKSYCYFMKEQWTRCTESNNESLAEHEVTVPLLVSRYCSVRFAIFYVAAVPYVIWTSCVAAGCGRHGMPLPACNNQTSQAMAVESACSNRLHQVWSSYIGNTLSVSALIDLVILTFNLLTSKQVHRLLVRCTSILSILGFLGLSVLELGRGTRQTDRRTDRGTDTGHHFIIPLHNKRSYKWATNRRTDRGCTNQFRSNNSSTNRTSHWLWCKVFSACSLSHSHCKFSQLEYSDDIAT